MPITLHWFLPTSGDGRDVVDVLAPERSLARGQRPPTLAYLAQIARAAEQVGFTGALTPTGVHCEDAWLTTIALSRESDRLKFLVAFRPGLLSPTLAAHQAATYQRLTGGRLLLNVVTGGEPSEQRRFGDWLDHDERYDRTAEFLTVLRGTAVSATTGSLPVYLAFGSIMIGTLGWLWAVGDTYMSEFFRTERRGTGFGIMVGGGRTASIFAPTLVDFGIATLGPTVPFLATARLWLLTIAGYLLGPETRGRQLEEVQI